MQVATTDNIYQDHLTIDLIITQDRVLNQKQHT